MNSHITITTWVQKNLNNLYAKTFKLKNGLQLVHILSLIFCTKLEFIFCLFSFSFEIIFFVCLFICIDQQSKVLFLKIL